MNKYFKIQISVLIGILGFFLGGILNIKKEIVDIVFNASIGWAFGFFFTFLILSVLIKEDDAKYNLKTTKNSISNNITGKKIDFIITEIDDSEKIYNLKR